MSAPCHRQEVVRCLIRSGASVEQNTEEGAMEVIGWVAACGTHTSKLGLNHENLDINMVVLTKIRDVTNKPAESEWFMDYHWVHCGLSLV